MTTKFIDMKILAIFINLSFFVISITVNAQNMVKTSSKEKALTQDQQKPTIKSPVIIIIDTLPNGKIIKTKRIDYSVFWNDKIETIREIKGFYFMDDYYPDSPDLDDSVPLPFFSLKDSTALQDSGVKNGISTIGNDD